MNLIVDFLIDYAGGPIPYLAIFLILLACGLGIPIPEDITLFAGGVLAYYGVCDVWWMIGVGLLGVMIGDSFVFLLGAKFGRKLIKKYPFRTFVDEKRIESIKRRLHSHGGKLLFSARFMPGFRSGVFFTAGLLHVPYRKLLIYDGLAAIVSVPAIVFSVYYFGDVLDRVIRYIKHVEGGIIFVIVVAAISGITYYYLKRKKHARNVK